MEIRRLRPQAGQAPSERTGIVVPLERRSLTGTRAKERQHALARALATEVGAEAPPVHLGAIQPQVQALLSRLASCRGVRHASLWTSPGEKVASVARREDDPSDLGVLMGALRAVADLALGMLDHGHVETVTASAGGLRIEMRVLESRFLLVLAVESGVPPERVQYAVSSVLCALHTTLETR